MSEYKFTDQKAKIVVSYLRELYALSKDFDMESQESLNYADELEWTDGRWLKVLYSASLPRAGFFNSFWLSAHRIDDASPEEMLRLNLMDDLIATFQIADTARQQMELIEERADYIQQRWDSVHTQCTIHAGMDRNSSVLKEFHDAAVECHDIERQLHECIDGYREKALQLIKQICIVAYGSEQKIPLPEDLIIEGCYLGHLDQAASLRSQIEPLYREAPAGTFPYQIQCLHEEMAAALSAVRQDLRVKETRYREAVLILRRQCPVGFSLIL